MSEAEKRPVALPPGARVEIDFRKWPDSKHWHYPMEYLGRDEHAHWLWAPAGTAAQRGDEGPIVFDGPRLKAISDGLVVRKLEAASAQPL